MSDNNRILAVVSDLMFTAKILDAAKRAGLHVDFAPTRDEALRLAATQPRLIILDLNNAAVNTLELLNELPVDGSRVLAYVSHVDADRIQAARQKGCKVVARSAFVKDLASLLN